MKEAYKNKILKFYKRIRRMPVYSEIMELLGFRSRNAVYKLVNQLVKDGFVSKDSSGRLIPNKLYGEIPFVGLVEAGFPSPAADELTDTMGLEEYLIDNKEATYLMRAKGESMIDAGIIDGDMLLVERTNKANTGEIVIALVDGDRTMKYLRQRGGKYYLEPANKEFKSIIPENELVVEAVVRVVIRKY